MTNSDRQRTGESGAGEGKSAEPSGEPAPFDPANVRYVEVDRTSKPEVWLGVDNEGQCYALPENEDVVDWESYVELEPDETPQSYEAWRRICWIHNNVDDVRPHNAELARLEPIALTGRTPWHRAEMEDRMRQMAAVERDALACLAERDLQEELLDENRCLVQAAGTFRVSEHDLADRAYQLRLTEAAREVNSRLSARKFEGYDDGTLAELLHREPDPPFRIEGLLPANGNWVVSAQNKTGKTTFVLNLARSLLTGKDFLDTFAVRRIKGSVAVWNYEVSGAQFARWAQESGIDPDRLYVNNLRRRPSPLTDPVRRAEAVRRLREHNVQVLIVDPFGRAFTGVEQNSNSEVQRWLDDLDVLAQEAEIEHVILTTHAGWNGEHSRGASALEGWPDAIITLTRNDGGVRFMRAEGRDVDLPEDALAFDPFTRRLSLTGEGSRSRATAQAAADRLEPAVLDVLANGPLKAGQISYRLREQGHSHKDAARVRAVESLVAQGLIAKSGLTYQLIAGEGDHS